MVVSTFLSMSAIILQTECERVREAYGWSLPVQVAVLLLHGGQAGVGLTVQGLLSFPRECRHEPVHLQHPLAVEVVAIRIIGEQQLVD